MRHLARGISRPARSALRRLFCALSLAGALAGCASSAFDSDQPYQQIYVLAGLAPRPAAGPILPADVLVAMPQVRPGLDTDRIAALYPDRRLDYFAASRWGGATDRLVQSVLVESLRNTGGMRSVHGDAAAFTAEFMLHTEVTDFQAEYPAQGGPPEAHVQLVVTLSGVGERRALASFISQARVPADSNTLRAVVAAFDQASKQTAAEIVELTRAALERAQPAAP